MDLDKLNCQMNGLHQISYLNKKRSRNSSDGEVENITYEMHSETKSLNSLLNLLYTSLSTWTNIAHTSQNP